VRRSDLDRLEAAVREANPVAQTRDLVDSDESAAVTLLTRRGRHDMTVKQEHEPSYTEPRSARSRRRVWAFVAAFTVTVLVVGLTVLLVAGNDSPVSDQPTTTVSEQATTTTTVATTTTEAVTEQTDEALVAAEEIVAALYTAWNEGNVEGVLSRVRVSEGTRNLITISIEGAGAKLAVECAPETHTATRAVEIRCSEWIVEDRFYAPAGVTWTNSVVYTVGTNGLALTEGTPIWVSGPKGEARDYLLAFDQWLFDRYQEGLTVTGWIWVDPNNGLLPNWLNGQLCRPYSVEGPTVAQGVFALVPEFLAEPGDPWPTTPTGTPPAPTTTPAGAGVC
jgi:hypothetical protein